MAARSSLLLLCSIFIMLCNAQNTSDEYWLNHFELNGEEQELFELLQVYRSRPLHLNKASIDELKAFPLLSNQQLQRLLDLKAKYGKILSIYELQQLPGMTTEALKALTPYIILVESARVKPSQHSLSLQTELIFPFSKAQLENKYSGDASRSRLRYTYSSAEVDIGLRLNKDPGEAWLNRSAFPFIDHSSAYLSFQPFGKVKSLVIGDLAMSYGQGLHLSTTSFVGGMLGIEQLKMNASGISPYRSNNPDLRYTGIGCSVALGNISIDLIKAKQSRSASTSNGSITGISNESGLHRTESEIKRMDQLEVDLSAICIQKEGKSYKTGILFSLTQYNKHFSSNTALHQLFSSTEKQRKRISIFYEKRHNNILHFAELMPLLGDLSIIEGMVISFGKLDLSASYRRYARIRHHLNTVSFSRWANSAAEEGIYTSFRYQFSRHRSLFISSDLFHSNWLRFSYPSLSHGSRYNLQYRTKINSKLKFQFSLKHEVLTEKERFEKSSYIQERRKTACRADLKWKSSLSEELRFRLEFKTMSGEQSSLLFIDHRSRLNYKWSTSVRFALYTIASSDLAIYAYERVAPGMNPSAAYFNSGNMCYLFINYRPTRYVRCFFKYTLQHIHGELTSYDKEMSYGSGDNERLGNRKHTFAMQLQLVI